MLRHSILPFAVLAVFCAGCDDAGPMNNLHPLGGTIQRDGQPVRDGGLIFIPDGSSSSLIVNGAVQANGTFTVRTEKTLSSGKLEVKPGAPAGVYKVVYHPPSDGATMGLEVELAERVTVEPGGTEVLLTLPTVMPKGRGEPRDDTLPEPKK